MQVEDELRIRAATEELSPKRLFYLKLVQTKDPVEAELAAGRLWLNLTRQEAMRSLLPNPQA